jgi:hypothetical protein
MRRDRVWGMLNGGSIAYQCSNLMQFDGIKWLLLNGFKGIVGREIVQKNADSLDVSQG